MICISRCIILRFAGISIHLRTAEGFPGFPAQSDLESEPHATSSDGKQPELSENKIPEILPKGTVGLEIKATTRGLYREDLGSWIWPLATKTNHPRTDNWDAEIRFPKTKTRFFLNWIIEIFLPKHYYTDSKNSLKYFNKISVSRVFKDHFYEAFIPHPPFPTFH